MLNSTFSGKHIILLFLAFLCTVLLLWWYFGFDGYYFHDDLDYARYAYGLSQGDFHLDASLFSHRLSVIFFTAFFYKLFGYSDLTTNLPPLVWTLLTLSLLFFGYYRRNPWAALLSATLFALDFYTGFFSNKLYPDGMVCTFTFAAAFLLWQVRRGACQRERGYATLFIGALWIAFLAKVTMFYTLPFFLALWIYDTVKKKNRVFWSTAVIVALISVIGAGVFYYLRFGDLFYRFEAIFEGHYVSSDSYFDKDWKTLLKRLTYQPLTLFIHSGMAVVLGTALPALLGMRKGKWWQYRQEEKYWAAYVLTILFFFWFCSTSLRYYNPIALFARHILLLVPPLAVLGGRRLFRLPEHARLYTLIFMFITLLSFIWHAGNMTFLYLLLTGFFGFTALNYQLNMVRLPKEALFMLFMLLLMVHPVYSMMKPSETHYASMKEALLRERHQLKGALVITDNLTCTHFPHLLNYQGHPACTDFSDSALREKIKKYDEVFLLVYDHHMVADAKLDRLFTRHILEKGQLRQISGQKGYRLFRVSSK